MEHNFTVQIRERSIGRDSNGYQVTLFNNGLLFSNSIIYFDTDAEGARQLHLRALQTQYREMETQRARLEAKMEHASLIIEALKNAKLNED